MDVPETLVRDVEGYGQSIVQEFRKGTAGSTSVPRPGDSELRRAALFDAIIGNLDRHAENYLIDQNGHLILIDNGLAFPERPQVPYGSGNFNFIDHFYGPAASLTQSERQLLTDFLTKRAEITKTHSKTTTKSGLPFRLRIRRGRRVFFERKQAAGLEPGGRFHSYGIAQGRVERDVERWGLIINP